MAQANSKERSKREVTQEMITGALRRAAASLLAMMQHEQDIVARLVEFSGGEKEAEKVMEGAMAALGGKPARDPRHVLAHPALRDAMAVAATEFNGRVIATTYQGDEKQMISDVALLTMLSSPPFDFATITQAVAERDAMRESEAKTT